MIKKQLIMIAMIAIALSACQSTPDNPAGQAAQASSINISEPDIGQTFNWGGEILQTKNLKSTTELTILGYPLDKYSQPDHDNPSTGRFIAVYSGFLEPTDFSKGKLVSMTGELVEIRDGKVSDADYRFPVLTIENIDLHKRKPKGFNLPFSIGIGIGIHN